MESLGEHKAVVVKSVDSDGFPYFNVHMLMSTISDQDFATLEQAQETAENATAGRVAWVHNSKVDCWSMFRLEETTCVC